MSKYNVEKLSDESQRTITGGVAGWGIAAAIATGIYLYDHREQVVEGYTDVMEKVL